ncbi:MAG: hypothetical protein LC637_11430 [Xanthomonadaceae bacterium]|nr:hypothetical protein [Xanthomonadaceae bacterium]
MTLNNVRSTTRRVAILRAAAVLGSVALACLGSAHGQWQPDIEAWNIATAPAQQSVIVRNATLWTADRAGIIDAHSHAAIIGGVNEATDISTAQVRIEDVIDSESINIYRQLAGGVTTINLLHGSANAIGGQMAVIKLRWGSSPQDLLFEAAPPGIKFALGENPKQSNWDNDQPRYPQTRPGVAQIITEKFQQAADYRRELESRSSARRARNVVEPRPDLEMHTGSAARPLSTGGTSSTKRAMQLATTRP